MAQGGSEVSQDPPQADIEHIGLLVVHGIGDQSRTEHLQSVAADLVRIASIVYGKQYVNTQMFPGLRNFGEISIIIKLTEWKYQAIHLNEVWWRDLGQKNTPSNIARFWLWAATFAGTGGRFAGENDLTTPPASKASQKGRVLFLDRFLLFVKISFFFIMLFPLRLITQLANFIPGIRRVSLFNTVFTYMSSVQMYQQRQGMKGGTLVDYNQSRRISIQRRFANATIEMAEKNYSRWYIMAHSLGSVIAFKGMMYPDRAFADFINMDRWHHRNMRFRGKDSRSASYPDAPRRSIWLADDDVLNCTKIFEKCAGLVTWGSPLETFARTWPAMVHLKRSASFDQTFEWINLYDAMDVISSRLSSFAAPTASIVPLDLSCISSNLIFSAHTSYFKPAKRLARKSPGAAVLRWMLDGRGDFRSICDRMGVVEVSAGRNAFRFLLKVAQFVAAMFIGLFMWPISFAAFARIMFFVPEEILRFLGVAVRQDQIGEAGTLNLFERWEISYRDFTAAVIGKISDLQPTMDWFDDVEKFLDIMLIVVSVVLIGGIMHNIYDRLMKWRAEDKNLIGSKEMALAEVRDTIDDAKSNDRSSK